MADSGKQSPLGVNIIGSLLQNTGFYINPVAQGYLGTCKYTDNADNPVPSADNDYKPGTLVNDTCLKNLTLAINDGYRRGAASQVDPLTPGATSINGSAIITSHIFQTVVLLQDQYIFSVYVKAGTGAYVCLYYDNYTQNGGAYFNVSSGATAVSAGTIISPTNLTATNAGNGYYRISAVWKMTAGPKNFYIAFPTNTSSLAATNGRTISLCYAQLELVPTPAVYTPSAFTVGGKNLFVNANAFNNNSWQRNYCYVSATKVTAYNGTPNAITLTTGYTLTAQTYNNLVSIGKSVIPALGNSPPDTWKTDDPSGTWTNKHTDVYTTDQAGAPANGGYPFYNWDSPPYQETVPTIQQRRELAYKNEGQLASWYPWLATNNNKAVINRGITMWGWLRCFPLQAWNEFNINGETVLGPVDYSNFCFSFSTSESSMSYTNNAIYPIQDGPTFLKGTYSNMNDLMSADVLGVCLANREFGQDLINLGNAIDFSLIRTFGLPSTILETLYNKKALTSALVLALMTAGLAQSDITGIANGTKTATKDQEQNIYAAMLVITGPDLEEILVTLNCSTKTIEVLADLADVKKMFPLSYQALTVPIYNTAPGPTNSKTYYPLFVGGEMNPVLKSPPVQEIVGTITPPPPPPSTAAPDFAQLVLPDQLAAFNSPSATNAPVTIESLIGAAATTPSATSAVANQIVNTTAGTGTVSCPAPWINITLADGTTIQAGDIEVGMMVYTKHHRTEIWGNYKVVAKEISQEERWKVVFTDGVQFVGTYNHRIWTEQGWIEIRSLIPSTKVPRNDGYIIVKETQYYDTGEVVKITVEDAHTYLTEGFISHNIKFSGNDLTG